MKLTIGLCLAVLLGACGGSAVPGCGDAEPAETALELVNEAIAEEVGAEVTSGTTFLDEDGDEWRFTMANIVTVAHDDQIDKYTCQGQLTVTVTFTATGKEEEKTAPLVFTSQPLADGAAGEFWVETDIQSWGEAIDAQYD